MIRRPPRSTQSRSSAASDVYKRQTFWVVIPLGLTQECMSAHQCQDHPEIPPDSRCHRSGELGQTPGEGYDHLRGILAQPMLECVPLAVVHHVAAARYTAEDFAGLLGGVVDAQAEYPRLVLWVNT